MKASDLMRPAVTVRPDDPATDLLRAFEQRDLRVVAVVSDHGELIGIVTDEDVLYSLLPPYVVGDEAVAGALERDSSAELHRRCAGKTVKGLVNVHRRQQPPVAPSDSIVEVADAIARTGEPAVPVVEVDRVVGVITVDDLLPALLGMPPPA